MTTFLIIIAVIVVIVFILAATAPKQMIIERTVSIHQPLSQVFDYLKFIKNQDNFSVWNMTDPQMSKSYNGIDGTVGFVYTWDSSTNKNVGAGEQEIIQIVEGESITCEVRFKRPMQNVAKTTLSVSSVSENTTEVKWGFYSPTKFPMSIMTGIFVKMLSKDIDKGLQNLKVILEN
jgi:hypothetical protein